jgi:alpha-ketoglutarate-dependent taurine dioxygenase
MTINAVGRAWSKLFAVITPIQIRHVDGPLGHHVVNVDLNRLDDATFAQIEDAFNRYRVIVIEGQTLSPDAQLAFSRRFGKEVRYPIADFQLPGFPDIFVVSNVIENGKPVGMADAGRLWHTDMMFTEAPPRCSLLYALEVPARDGAPLDDTLFASTAAAYDALPEATRRGASTACKRSTATGATPSAATARGRRARPKRRDRRSATSTRTRIRTSSIRWWARIRSPGAGAFT